MKKYLVFIDKCDSCPFFKRATAFVYVCTHPKNEKLLNLNKFEMDMDCPLSDAENCPYCPYRD
jgi:hypothetical protein